MIKQIRYYCRCGDRAVVEHQANGDWFCLACALEIMMEDIRRGEPVVVSFGSMGISNVLVVPDGDGDLLAPLAEVVPVSFCRN